jgi:HTH-type transcriptional regulator/antitoxin HigA
MDIRPIVTADDHVAALREIERLWGAKAGTPDGDALDILVTLAAAYEDKHFLMEASDPIEVITTHMEMTGRTQRDLAILFGSPSRASEVLNRRRALTMDMARKLHHEWGIPAEALIEPYELDSRLKA